MFDDHLRTNRRPALNPIIAKNDDRHSTFDSHFAVAFSLRFSFVGRAVPVDLADLFHTVAELNVPAADGQGRRLRFPVLQRSAELFDRLAFCVLGRPWPK
jgi:hypothetical protein